PPSLAALRPELGPGIDAVVAKALSKRAEDRYASAGELARAATAALSPSASRVTPLTRGFLFADLRGYTDFVDTHGDRAAAELLDAYRRLVRNAVRGHHGAEIKTEGDGFYVVFPSASAAVACGLAIVDAAAIASREHPEAPTRVAIGIHAGESTRTDDGYVGLAVNTAARLCALAQAGDVLVSETVRSIARTSHDFSFEPRGRKTLKGITEPVAVFAVRSSGAGTPAPESNRGVRRPPPPTRAVAIVGLGGLALVAAVALATTGLPALTASREPTPTPPASIAAVASQPPASAAIAASGSPSPSPAGSGTATALTLTDDQPMPLEPGRYRPAEFQLPTQFEIPKRGWVLDREYADGFSLLREDSVDTLPIGYVGGSFVQVVIDGPCLTSKTRALPREPTALIDWLQSNRWLHVSDPKPINLSGYTGLTVDVSQAKSPKGACDYSALEVPDPARKRIETQVYIFEFGEDNFHVDVGEKVRVIVLDVGGRSLTLLVGVTDSAGFDAFTQDEAQPILDSLVFSP
ncbi:MAG TPA: adenylate/guanylate cyclase domain-containing protein, partial [Candidatus Limnocylindrales bacterium]|nr:adenylate/guanylate cyclase domain-containing protein [Candidatus Limnocylindrales bacterium]